MLKKEYPGWWQYHLLVLPPLTTRSDWDKNQSISHPWVVFFRGEWASRDTPDRAAVRVRVSALDFERQANSATKILYSLLVFTPVFVQAGCQKWVPGATGEAAVAQPFLPVSASRIWDLTIHFQQQRIPGKQWSCCATEFNPGAEDEGPFPVPKQSVDELWFIINWLVLVNLFPVCQPIVLASRPCLDYWARLKGFRTIFPCVFFTFFTQSVAPSAPVSRILLSSLFIGSNFSQPHYRLSRLNASLMCFMPTGFVTLLWGPWYLRVLFTSAVHISL